MRPCRLQSSLISEFYVPQEILSQKRLKLIEEDSRWQPMDFMSMHTHTHMCLLAHIHIWKWICTDTCVRTYTYTESWRLWLHLVIVSLYGRYMFWSGLSRKDDGGSLFAEEMQCCNNQLLRILTLILVSCPASVTPRTPFFSPHDSSAIRQTGQD